MLRLTLGEMRPFLDRTALYSVLMVETMGYENYLMLCDIPRSYDECYIYGIGLVETEFWEGESLYDGHERGVPMSTKTEARPNLHLEFAIELALSEQPRTE